MHYIINNAKNCLADARFGLEIAQQKGNYEMVRAGIKQAISEGRSATFAIQHLKGKADGFEEWYAEQQKRMKENPLFPALNELRTGVAHEGRDPVHIGTHFHSMKGTSLKDLMAKYPAPHPDATFFIGDPQGRSGWMMPTTTGFGIGRKFYVDLPEDDPDFDVRFTTHLHGMPDDLKYEEADKLLRTYLVEVEGVILEAEQRFLTTE